MTDLYDPDRDDALPSNATPLERSLAQTEGRLDDVDMDLVHRVASSNIAEVPARFLLHRAWGGSVDVYDPAWPEDVRRAAITVAPVVHLFKGTRYAVQTALSALNIMAEITEWWQETPRTAPYTFRVTAFVGRRIYDGAILDARTVRVAYATIDRAKPLSRAYTMKILAHLPSDLGLAAAIVGTAKVRALLRPSNGDELAARLGLSAAVLGRVRVRALMIASP